MSQLPGFRKAGITKFSELEMEDTFLQNLQVMNGGNKHFHLEDSLLMFQKKAEENPLGESILEIGSTEGDEATKAIFKSIFDGEVMYRFELRPEQSLMHSAEGTTLGIFPGKIYLESYDEETGQIYDTEPVLLNEQGKIDSQYLPGNTTGITKASEMNQPSFWDTDVIVPTGHTLTNADGLDADQIKTGTFSTGRIPSLSAGKITSGTFNLARIPNLNASMITEGTLEKERLSEISYSDLPLQIRLTYDAGNQEYHHYLFEDSSGQSIYSRATYKIINSKLTLIDIYNVDIYELSPYVEYILPDPENPEQDIKMHLEVIGNASEPTIRGTILPIIPSTVTNIINSFASSTKWNFGVIDFSYAHCIIDSSSFSSSNTSGTIDVSSYTYRQLRKDGLIGSDSQRYLSSNNNITIRIKN